MLQEELINNCQTSAWTFTAMESKRTFSETPWWLQEIKTKMSSTYIWFLISCSYSHKPFFPGANKMLTIAWWQSMCCFFFKYHFNLNADKRTKEGRTTLPPHPPLWPSLTLCLNWGIYCPWIKWLGAVKWMSPLYMCGMHPALSILLLLQIDMKKKHTLSWGHTVSSACLLCRAVVVGSCSPAAFCLCGTWTSDSFP